MAPAPPRIASVSVRYTTVTHFSVTVSLVAGGTFDMAMTADQYRRTRNHIADTGSAPVPTGEHA